MTRLRYLWREWIGPLLGILAVVVLVSVVTLGAATVVSTAFDVGLVRGLAILGIGVAVLVAVKS